VLRYLRLGSIDGRDEELTGTLDVRNRVILALLPKARSFLEERLLTRPMSAGDVIFKQGAPITHVVFPHDGVISLMTDMDDGRNIKKASVGREGVLGFHVALGEGNAIATCLVQVPGYASWLTVADLQEALTRFACVRKAMLRYAMSVVAQALDSVACNSLHLADQRIARWLLQTHDRMSSDTFPLKQTALAQALGLRRATVSAACSRMLDQGTIRYSRGTVTIIDRAGIESIACECYGRVQKATQWWQ
jgi:CRP-like cAMP-binding protein